VQTANAVFIGSSSYILKCVTIGDRAVNGMGSVVTGDVSELAIVVGNPAFSIGVALPARNHGHGMVHAGNAKGLKL